MMMYSNAGPVMVEPSGFVAIGSPDPGPPEPPILMLKLAELVPAEASHPLHTIV